MQNVDYLIEYLENENSQIGKYDANTSEEKFNLYRALCNIRQAKPISDEYLKKEAEYLAEINKLKDITMASDIKTLIVTHPDNKLENSDKISLWQGDITTLNVDAIVNAANSQGLGCFIPGHNCIDNQINTFAGVQLRLECDEYMKTINYNLPTGTAFITKGYNLPAKCVIHTVGPIINDVVREDDKILLANCYINCLNVAKENNIRTLAFCSISTGVFRFPKQLACQIATKTVDNYLKDNKDSFDNIIFNVYSREDYDIYENLFKTNR